MSTERKRVREGARNRERERERLCVAGEETKVTTTAAANTNQP